MTAITPTQCHCARVLLKWDQKDLADRCGLHVQTICMYETEQSTPTKRTLAKITTAFENAGIEFLEGNGIRQKTNNILVLKGENAMSDFLDDVYLTAIKYGTKANPTEIYLSNVLHQNWIKWMGSERWKNHTDRMTQDKDIMDVRIIVKEGDYNFPASAYSKYKWIKKDFFNEKSFYSYHDRLAFLDFKENELTVSIMKNQDFAKGYRDLFLIAWNNVAIIPPAK